MFVWLKRLLGWKTEEYRLDIYSPKQRAIFRYFDGQKVRDVDPMVIYRKIMDGAADLSIAMKVARSGWKGEAAKAHDEMIADLRGIFGVKSLDEGGLTEPETAELFVQFMNYCGWVKKNWSPPTTLPEDVLPSTSPSPDGGSPTPNSSGSGSSAAVPPTAPPTPLPLEPE